MWQLCVGAVVFTLLAVASVPALRGRALVLWLLHRLLQAGLAALIVTCALFHFCPDATPSELNDTLEPLVETLHQEVPWWRYAALVGSFWLVLAVVLVAGGLPLLARLERALARSAPHAGRRRGADSKRPTAPSRQQLLKDVIDAEAE